MTDPNTTHITDLPLEVMYSILILNKPSEILNLCQVNEQYHDICLDTLFWSQKLNYDYPSTSEFVRVREDDIGYALYERFDDGYDGPNGPDPNGYLSVIAQNSDPNTVNCAAVTGNIKVLRKFIDEFHIIPDQDAIDAACTLPNANSMMIVLFKRKIYPSQLGVNWAAYTGNYRLLKWLIPQGFIPNYIVLDWLYQKRDYDALSMVADLIGNWNEYMHGVFMSKVGRINRATCAGYLDVVQWLTSTQNMLPEISAIDTAAFNGHYDVIHWLYMNYELVPSNRAIYVIKRQIPGPVQDFLNRILS